MTATHRVSVGCWCCVCVFLRFSNRHFILETDKLSHFCPATARFTSQVIGPRRHLYHLWEQSNILSAFIYIDWLWVKSSVYSFFNALFQLVVIELLLRSRHRAGWGSRGPLGCAGMLST